MQNMLLFVDNILLVKLIIHLHSLYVVLGSELNSQKLLLKNIVMFAVRIINMYIIIQ